MNMMMSVLGMIGGLLCCVGDILFDYKGKGNQKLGTSGNIDSNWMHMAYWRFGASILVAFFGVVLTGLGIFSVADQIRAKNDTLAAVMLFFGYAGCVGGFFVHSVLCIQPVIYKKIMEENRFELADQTLEQYYKAILLPFIVSYAALMVPCVCVIIAVLAGYLDVPKWFALLNSIVFLLIGVGLRKIKPEWFFDLPGIIMPSLGLSMIGLIGIVNLL